MAHVEARRPRLVRSRDDRWLAGVAGGIAQHLGVSSNAVRVAFVVSTFAAGFGVIVYVLTLLLAPLEERIASGADAPPPSTAPVWRRLPRISTPQAVGIGLVAIGVAVLLGVSGLWFGGAQGWPLLVAAIGFAVLWARREGTGRLTLPGLGAISWPRVAIGGMLVVLGMGAFLAANTSIAAAGNVLFAMVVAVGGVALLAGPWAWNMGQQLVEERSSRARSEARAEMAAHLHDSVLQTLALIQRAETPREMASLARTQERELRAWLYGRAPEVEGARLRDAIDAMAGRIERLHQVRVETVVVGDAELDDRLRALVDASAEAVANAARHSGSETISLYVEVETDAVSAFVRDQGRGFDPEEVPDDRRGIADSIIGRIERRGGSVRIDSTPGSGTEVVIRVPRPAQVAAT
ncbi:MAG TPA: PspC domain-containing protein [Candidatus Limnocylindria bacterium]|nr:PspC domain-containing protein [Candidatus Limnocylindria bacterium]